MRPSTKLLGLLAASILAAGCGATSSGPYHLSGKVTYKGVADAFDMTYVPVEKTI